MAINVSQAFHRTSANPIDDSLALTKAEMLLVNDNLMPAYYFTVCQDDGCFYLYDKSATASPTTGKFTKFEGGGSADNIVWGYHKAADGKFYKEAAYTTLITGEANKVYVALNENASYIFDGTDFIRLDEEANEIVWAYHKEADGKFYEEAAYTTEITGETGKLYIALNEDKSYRYDGSDYVVIGGGGDASLTQAVTSNLAVGAIASGTTLAKDTTFTEFVQKLLITEIAPTIAMSMTKSGNVLYGGSYTETLTINVSAMGTAKSIDTIAWYEGSTLLQTDTIGSTTTGSWTYTMATATTDTTTFKAVVTYKKSDNTQTSETKTSTINFFYNKFYGSVDTLTPSEATVEALTTTLGTSKGGTYTFTTTAARICYAYPKSLGALTKISDSSGFSLFESFSRSEQTYTQNSTAVDYYLYVLTDPTSVSSYKVTFG